MSALEAQPLAARARIIVIVSFMAGIGPSTARHLPTSYRPDRGAITMTMHAADVLALKDAVRAIERPSVGARIASVVGSPIERLIGMLPARASSVISAAARKAIHGALELSLRTLATHDPLAR